MRACVHCLCCCTRAYMRACAVSVTVLLCHGVDHYSAMDSTETHKRGANTDADDDVQQSDGKRQRGGDETAVCGLPQELWELIAAHGDDAQQRALRHACSALLRWGFVTRLGAQVD